MTVQAERLAATEVRRVRDLHPHPRNAAIYGDGADHDFVESVRTHGVLVPLLIAADGTIISGHRRWDAARQLELYELPVQVYPSADEWEILGALLEANNQRVKTNEQVGREYAAALEVESVQAGRRRSATLKQNQAAAADVLTSTPRDGDNGKARDRAAERVGVGWQKGQRAAAVVQVVDCLREEGKVQEAEQLRQTLNAQSPARAYQQAVERGYIPVGKPAAQRAEGQAEDFDRLIADFEAACKVQQTFLDDPLGSVVGLPDDEVVQVYEWARRSVGQAWRLQAGLAFMLAEGGRPRKELAEQLRISTQKLREDIAIWQTFFARDVADFAAERGLREESGLERTDEDENESHRVLCKYYGYERTREFKCWRLGVVCLHELATRSAVHAKATGRNVGAARIELARRLKEPPVELARAVRLHEAFFTGQNADELDTCFLVLEEAEFYEAALRAPDPVRALVHMAEKKAALPRYSAAHAKRLAVNEQIEARRARQGIGVARLYLDPATAQGEEAIP